MQKIFLKENKKKFEKELCNYDRLQNQYNKVSSELEEKDKNNKPLEIFLRSAMSDFKWVWFKRMIDWYNNHYLEMRKRLPKAKSRLNRVKVALNYFQYNHKWNEYKSVKSYLDNVIKLNSEIVMDKANRMEQSEYIEFIKKILNEDWEKGVLKLVDKCSKFCLNESKIKVHNPDVTDKGFEVMITDGGNRHIYARVIWAAEFSYCVTPHTRYIVTEKRIK